MKNLFAAKGTERIKRSAPELLFQQMLDNKILNLSGEIDDKYKEGRHKKKKEERRETNNSLLLQTPENNDNSELDDFCFCISKFTEMDIIDENQFEDAMKNFFGRVSKLSEPKTIVTDFHIQQLDYLKNSLLQESDREMVSSWISRLKKWVNKTPLGSKSIWTNGNAVRSDRENKKKGEYNNIIVSSMLGKLPLRVR